MANVLVTGGAGFIGSYLTDALLCRGDQVLVIDDESTGRFENLAAVRNQPRLKLVRGSVGDPALVRDSLDEITEVYHLAAAVGVALIAREPLQTIERNIYPTQLLLDELCRCHRAGQNVKFFLASTSEVYGKNPKPVWTEEDDLVFGSTTRPRWSYGASKAIDDWQPNQPHHVAAVWGKDPETGDNITALYVDGHLTGPPQNYDGTFEVSPGTPLLIGSDYRGDAAGAGGTMSNFQGFNQVLSGDRVANLAAGCGE